MGAARLGSTAGTRFAGLHESVLSLKFCNSPVVQCVLAGSSIPEQTRLLIPGETVIANKPPNGCW